MADYLPSTSRLLARMNPVLVRWGVLALHAELLADGSPRTSPWTLLGNGLSAASEEGGWATLVDVTADGVRRHVLSAYAPGVTEPGSQSAAWHLDGAPAWVEADPSQRYSLIAWAEDGRWEATPRREVGVDARRPWSHPAVAATLEPLTSDEATIEALAMLLWWSADPWSYDPGRTWAGELLPLARIAWNAMVDPDVALDPGALADHLVVLSGHLRRAAVPRVTAERTARLAYQLWGHLAGEAPLGVVSLTRPPAAYDAARRTMERADVLPVEGAEHVAPPARPDPADQEFAQAVHRTLGWGVAAVREAAAGSPKGSRRLDLDSHGLVAHAPDGRVVRLIALDPAHLVLSVHRRPPVETEPGLFGRLFGRRPANEPAAPSVEAQPLPPLPGWVPADEIRQADGEVLDLDWCIRGRWDYRRWSGEAAGGFAMPGALEALAGVAPLGADDLDAALADVHPVSSTALEEVTAMRDALAAFVAGRAPLGV
ncbi:hypothetical protein [Raineyella fluvialis]|uniref:Uncharacterized protein n=1 Tax=Raineyella fluvialis TaxID=2662261 RepID=A0A5Q2F8H4_9ACTN|nr:hypothetical protein [Raineyella fluvialis]QGF22968.1 hypothetical protein Rai3103_04000 [Raineyella fluvialis]